MFPFIIVLTKEQCLRQRFGRPSNRLEDRRSYPKSQGRRRQFGIEVILEYRKRTIGKCPPTKNGYKNQLVRNQGRVQTT